MAVGTVGGSYRAVWCVVWWCSLVLLPVLVFLGFGVCVIVEWNHSQAAHLVVAHVPWAQRGGTAL